MIETVILYICGIYVAMAVTSIVGLAICTCFEDVDFRKVRDL